VYRNTRPNQGTSRPQREALATALGVIGGHVPERFLVGLAVLTLLSALAEQRPMLCLVEDAHWLDAASAHVLGLVARRVRAESAAIVVALREPADGRDFDGLPELGLEGLPEPDAATLLASVVTGRLDGRVADRIVAETRGNPLALLELPARMTAADLAGFELPGAAELPPHVEDHYLRRIRELPEATQHLMLVAAAEPLGDPDVVLRAARRLDIKARALGPAQTGFGVFDGVGHDIAATRSTALALTAVRNARRAGVTDLLALAAESDRVLLRHGDRQQFVTAVLADLATATGRLRFLLAGHPAPMLFPQGRFVTELKHPPRPPLGLDLTSLGIAEPTVREVQLEPGDRLLFYSDGVTEARDANGVFFGGTGLIDMTVRAHLDRLPAPETLRRLAAVLAHRDGELQDDLTLLLLEWSPADVLNLMPSLDPTT
jgi:hypothetical protein